MQTPVWHCLKVSVMFVPLGHKINSSIHAVLSGENTRQKDMVFPAKGISFTSRILTMHIPIICIPWIYSPSNIQHQVCRVSAEEMETCFSLAGSICVQIHNRRVEPDCYLIHSSWHARWKYLAIFYYPLLPSVAKLSIFSFPLTLKFPSVIPYCEKHSTVYYQHEFKKQ